MSLMQLRNLGVVAPRVLFQNLDLAIHDVDRIGLIAGNGAGKSTLLRCLAGQIEPGAGAVTRRRGLRIGFTLTLLGVLLAEMFAAKHGLGSLIINAMQLMQAEEMLTVAVVLFAFAALANALLLWIEHRLHRRV